MLKRNQILLDDWMVDFLKWRGKEYRISLSETIRMVICLYYLMFIGKECKKYKFDMTVEKNLNMAKECLSSADPKKRDKMQKTMSDIYFNARKAMECFMETEKKKNTKAKRKAE